MEPLPGDLQRLLYADPEVFERMIRTSENRARFGYENPRLLQSYCDQDIRLSEIQHHLPAFLKSTRFERSYERRSELSLFKLPPMNPIEGSITGSILLLVEAFKDPLTNRFKNDQYQFTEDLYVFQEGRWILRSSTSPRFDDSLPELIEDLYQRGFTRVEPALQHFIYQQRTSCVQRIPNYADNQVLRTFRSDTDRLLEFVRRHVKVPGAWHALFQYLLVMSISLRIEDLLPDDDEMIWDEEDNVGHLEADPEIISKLEENLIQAVVNRLYNPPQY